MPRPRGTLQTASLLAQGRLHPAGRTHHPPCDASDPSFLSQKCGAPPGPGLEVVHFLPSGVASCERVWPAPLALPQVEMVSGPLPAPESQALSIKAQAAG